MRDSRPCVREARQRTFYEMQNRDISRQADQNLQEGESGNCERSFEHSSDRERSVRSLDEKESGACLRPREGLELILRAASLERSGGSPSLLHLSPSMTSSSVLIKSAIAVGPEMIESGEAHRGLQEDSQKQEGERKERE